MKSLAVSGYSLSLVMEDALSRGAEVVGNETNVQDKLNAGIEAMKDDARDGPCTDADADDVFS
jgi:hypothetical protein